MSGVRDLVSDTRDAVIDRWFLLVILRDAGLLMVGIAAMMRVAQSLLLPFMAVVTGALIARLLPDGAHDPVMAEAVGPFLLLVLLLLIGHAIDVAIVPVSYRIKSRIDGTHRRRVATWCASTPTIEPLESPEVRNLIRQASAEPDNWTERTPGDGALTQVTALSRYVGLAMSCAALSVYAPWYAPVVLVPALLGRALRRRQWLSASRQWTVGMAEGRRATYWRDVLTRAGEAKEVRVFGFAEWAIARMESHVLAMYLPVWRRQLAVAARQWAPFLLAALPLSAVFLAAVTSSAHRHDSVAAAAATIAVATSVYQLVGGTSEVLDIEGAIPAVRASRQLNKVLSARAGAPTDVTTAPTEVPRGLPLVAFHDVSFSYPDTEAPVLDRLNLVIRPGELLAVVGLNGAGKSTLIKLLAGLYQPETGHITADGVDLRALDPAAWRRQLSVIFQDFVRYELSASDNLLLGRADLPADRVAMEAAAGQTGAARLFDRLPGGWDTPLSRNRSSGVDLSGGEWQQVVLARAQYAVHLGARLLVLDEPTAHLDVRTELEVFRRLADTAGDISVVIISHRLSTVRHADRIVVLDKGRIVESGTHDELMRLRQSYATMFEVQARSFAASAGGHRAREAEPA